MTQLEKLYQTIQNLKELGYPLDEKMLRDLDQLEEALIEKEVLPALANTIAPTPLISDTRDDFYPQHELSPGVLIMTYSATKTKKEMLDEVSEKLGLGLEVKIV